MKVTVLWYKLLHWYYRFQIDRKTKKIQEFNEWIEKQKKYETQTIHKER